MQDNEPAMSMVGGGVGNVQGQELPQEAIKSAQKALTKYYDAHAQDLLNQPNGAEVLGAIVQKANSLSQNPKLLPAKGMFQSASITPEGDIQQGGSLGGISTQQLLNNLLKLSEVQKNRNQSISIDPEESVKQLTSMNKRLKEEGLGDYQATQTASGQFIVHPKAAGVLAQIEPEQMNQMSDALLSGQVVPSQLPRTQKNQVIAAALAKNPEYNPAYEDMKFAANKMGAGTFVRNFNNIDSYHRMFEKNGQLLLSLSERMNRSKFPLINKAIMSEKINIEGDPLATRFAQAVYTQGLEFARIQNPTLSGQSLTDAARKEAEEILNRGQSHEQLKALLDKDTGSLSIEARNRIETAKQVRDEILSPKKKEEDLSSLSDDELRKIAGIK